MENSRKIEKDLSRLKTLITNEIIKDTSSYQTFYIKNADLKSILLLYKVDEISVRYNSSVKKDYTYNVASIQDSTITFSWNKSKNETYISQNVVYIPFNDDFIKEKKLNDSIYLQRLESELVIIP